VSGEKPKIESPKELWGRPNCKDFYMKTKRSLVLIGKVFPCSSERERGDHTYMRGNFGKINEKAATSQDKIP
jgi:hypothetical protein